jgi:hypothetical protein
MNQVKFAVFSEAYRKALPEAVASNPKDYAPNFNSAVVADRMLAQLALAPSMVNYDSKGFKLVCKALEIKPTRKAIFEYLEVQP